MVGIHVGLEALPVDGLGLGIEAVSPRRKIDAPVAEQHRLRTRDGTHADIEVELLDEPVGAAPDLVEQGSANDAGANQADRDRL